MPRYIELARKRLKHHEEAEQPIMPPLNEDLSGLTETEIVLEMTAIEQRIKKNIVQPEGIDGLNYRHARLEAQLKVITKQKEQVV